jgi:hypothetical protein
MQTYRALRRGFALRITSAISGPVNSAVESPAAPHEKPFDFRTTFCSLRLLPAQTSVMGAVTWANSSKICLKLNTMGLSTNLALGQYLRETDVVHAKEDSVRTLQC